MYIIKLMCSHCAHNMSMPDYMYDQDDMVVPYSLQMIMYIIELMLMCSHCAHNMSIPDYTYNQNYVLELYSSLKDAWLHV